MDYLGIGFNKLNKGFLVKTTLLAVLTALLLIGCGSTSVQPEQQFTQSEMIANCVEDYQPTQLELENMEYMSTIESIDYIGDIAVEYCESKYD